MASKKKPTVKNKFKIHAMNTQEEARPGRRHVCNTTFYEDYDEALKNAKSYASGASGKPMVIYEAITIVQPKESPVEVIDL